MRNLFLFIFIILLFTACDASAATEPTEPVEAETLSPVLTETLTTSTLAPTQPPIGTSTLQPLPSPVSYGPDEFPEGYNPLTGQRVAEPPLLDIPALLISISHFPPAARPQAG